MGHILDRTHSMITKAPRFWWIRKNKNKNAYSLVSLNASTNVETAYGNGWEFPVAKHFESERTECSLLNKTKDTQDC